MNIQVLFDIMSDRATYHAAVAETVPCKLWANSSDMFSAVVANGNNTSQAQLQAELFKDNRNEMLYDYVSGAETRVAPKKKPVMTHLFTKSTNAMLTMPTCQSFASNLSNAVMNTKDNVLSIQYHNSDEYRFEDVHEEDVIDVQTAEHVLEDVTPTNVIQFVPRKTRKAS